MLLNRWNELLWILLSLLSILFSHQALGLSDFTPSHWHYSRCLLIQSHCINAALSSKIYVKLFKPTRTRDALCQTAKFRFNDILILKQTCVCACQRLCKYLVCLNIGLNDHSLWSSVWLKQTFAYNPGKLESWLFASVNSIVWRCQSLEYELKK